MYLPKTSPVTLVFFTLYITDNKIFFARLSSELLRILSRLLLTVLVIDWFYYTYDFFVIFKYYLPFLNTIFFSLYTMELV